MTNVSTNLSAPGQIAAPSPLSGQEIVTVNNGPVFVGVTTQQIANLAVQGTGTVTTTISSTTPPVTRLQDVEMVLSGATVAVVGNGSLVAMKGGVTINSGTDVTSGYVYGVEGKIVCPGQYNGGSDYLAGVVAQMDLNNATITSGHVAALIANIQNPIANSYVDGIYIESSGPANINSMLKAIVNSNFVFDLAFDSGAPGSMATTSSTVGSIGTSGWLKINVNGTTRYIGLGATVS